MAISQIRVLPELRLDQDGVSETVAFGLVEGSRKQSWYVYPDMGFYAAGREEESSRGVLAIATVAVILPTTMMGSQDQINVDIHDAVVRHADKHLGDA